MRQYGQKEWRKLGVDLITYEKSCYNNLEDSKSHKIMVKESPDIIYLKGWLTIFLVSHYTFCVF